MLDIHGEGGVRRQRAANNTFAFTSKASTSMHVALADVFQKHIYSEFTETIARKPRAGLKSNEEKASSHATVTHHCVAWPDTIGQTRRDGFLCRFFCNLLCFITFRQQTTFNLSFSPLCLAPHGVFHCPYQHLSLIKCSSHPTACLFKVRQDGIGSHLDRGLSRLCSLDRELRSGPRRTRSLRCLQSLPNAR